MLRLMGESRSEVCDELSGWKPTHSPLTLVGSTARFAQGEEFPIGIAPHHIEQISKLWGTGALRDTFFPGLPREVVDDDTYKSMERLIARRATVRQLK
jgi:hypothetical protein